MSASPFCEISTDKSAYGKLRRSKCPFGRDDGDRKLREGLRQTLGETECLQFLIGGDWDWAFRLLLLSRLLDGAKDVGYFPLQRGEVEVDDAASGVEDDVHRSVERGQVFANDLPHAAFDAVAVDGLAHDFADGEADAGGVGVGVAEGGAVGPKLRAEGEEVAHLLAELFAAGLVDALVIGMFAQAEGDGRFCFAEAGRRGGGGLHSLILERIDTLKLLSSFAAGGGPAFV
jgi:hypothetical protein